MEIGKIRILRLETKVQGFCLSFISTVLYKESSVFFIYSYVYKYLANVETYFESISYLFALFKLQNVTFLLPILLKL